MTTLYGIKNCDTVQKARRWLEQHQIDYTFHDFRVDGLPATTVQQWVARLGWQALLNKRSTTWRQLDPAQQQTVGEQTIVSLLCEQPTLIKRPVLEHQQTLLLGFSAEQYTQLIG